MANQFQLMYHFPLITRGIPEDCAEKPTLAQPQRVLWSISDVCHGHNMEGLTPLCHIDVITLQQWAFPVYLSDSCV